MRGRLLTGLVVSLAVIGVPPRLAAAPVVTVAQAALTAADAAETDNFGFSVSLGGDTALIGAPGDDTPARINAGSARVFVRSPQGWTEHATLTAPDAVADDRLGWSVSMDGDTAALGVPFDDLDGAVNGGSVRIFARHAGVWTEQAVLTAPDPAEGDVFGFSVAVSGDTVLVGAVGDDTDDERGIGVAYTYVRSGETWPLEAELRPTDARASDNFGFSVGLDGDTAVVGMVGDDTPDVSEGGSARVFTRSMSQWTEQATLAASDAAPDDLFGYSVAVHRDTAVVGAVGDDTPAGGNAGSARVFARSGTSWQEVATLASGMAASGDNLGFSVAVDRDTAIVGAVGDDHAGPDAGAARIFMRVDGTWSEQPPLTAGDAVFADNLGQSVDVDGHSAMVGAPRDNTAAGGDAGSAAIAVLDQAPTAAPDTYLVEDGNPLIVEAAQGVLATTPTSTVTLSPWRWWTRPPRASNSRRTARSATSRIPPPRTRG